MITNKMRICHLLFLSLLFISCKRDLSSSKQKSERKLSQDSLRILRTQELAEAKEDHTIYSAVVLSKDTIILLRRPVGLEYSTNGGKTWQWIAKSIFRVDELTVDNKGIWWALKRWKGIHEASDCSMYKSTDKGKTWKKYTFNTSVFFPYHFYSKPHQKLAISTHFENTVYQLSGTNPRRNWQFIKKQPNDNQIDTVSTGNYFIHDSGYDDALCVKRDNKAIDTLIRFTKADLIYYIEQKDNELFVAGPDKDGRDLYFAVIKKEKIQKEFTIPGGEKMQKSSLVNIIITGSSGAYVYKNNKVTPIYK
ncbi:WD40/YVTN/BNR-like repeat-containing protein [Mucilaginibacter aquatilis]|uniref:Exo-alpha-sialidase n=1 Tax=Mucilaginibacter aquatilis TaxID=1517760 RepID=A0A6I4IDM0_9SPHI|nr:sialidase family protein [Mucilaginibacter aquatilis]MVN91918.1 hypothetical protein [Mucilaginibacter aquatilis]